MRKDTLKYLALDCLFVHISLILLSLQLPQDIKASDIKWLTIWCEVFGISFGEVQFPNLKGKL